MAEIRYRSPLEPSPRNGTAIDDTVLTFTLPTGVIEITHKGDHLEIYSLASVAQRVLIEPVAGNMFRLSLEPAPIQERQ